MKAKKSVRLIAVMTLCMLFTTGCWDKIEIEDRLFVLAIGVDKVKKEEQHVTEDRYTLSFVAPVVSEDKEGPAPTFNTYQVVNNSVIMSLSQLLERFSQKQFFGHTRAIFFGEDIMKDEKLFKKVVDGISRYHELHNSMYIYVVPGRAEDVFKVKPKYDKLLMPYITGITENSDYTSNILKLTLSDVIISLTDQKGGLVIPRLIPEKEDVNMSGAGVIKDYKLIGYLEDKEVGAYNRLMNKAKGGYVSVEYNGAAVAFRHFTFRRDIKLSKVEDGKIYLNYNMETEGSIEEYILGQKILDDVLIREVEKKVEKNIETESEKLIKKFQKEFGVDLIGVGDYLSKYQPKLFKTIEGDYDTYFINNIEIKVTADAHIRRVGFIR